MTEHEAQFARERTLVRAGLIALVVVCGSIITNCELTNRMMVETARINERAAESGLEEYMPNTMNGIRYYRPKQEPRP